MRVGVHCSVRKGFVGALEEAAALGCETLQMFTTNPRGWKSRIYHDEEFTLFRERRASIGLDPIIVHSPYLPNLCTNNTEIYDKSRHSLREDLIRCEKLGAQYLVIHPGAYSPDGNPATGYKQLQAAFNEVLDEVGGQATILIENMAGGGRRLGGTFTDIAEMLSGIRQSNRVAVCFDTCHALAAGYDIHSLEGVDKTLEEFKKTLGLGMIKVFHVNDSKGPIGCHRDRHENLGQGYVGLAGLTALFNHEEFKNCSYILETPKEPMPQADFANLEKLRNCLPVWTS
jgi:deoxyribonuclease-4